MKRKKIFYIIPHFARSGPTRQLFYLINELAFECDITIYCLLPEKKGSVIDEFLNLNIKIHESNKINFFVNWFKLIYFRLIIKDTIFHSYGLVPDILCSLLLSKKNWISVARNYPLEDYPDKFGFFSGNAFAKLHLFAHRNCLNLVTCSEALSDKYNHLKIKNVPIQNSVKIDQLTINDMKKNDKLKKEFLFVGNIRDLKRVDFVCEYFLGITNTNSLLNIVGNGPELEKLKNYYKKHENIIFHGHSTNVINFYKSADYFINLSSSEGMPNAVLEALSYGCPCILSDIPPHVEITKYVDKGILIIKDNIKIDDAYKFSLFEKSLSLDDKSIIRKQLAERFSTKRLKKEFYKLYDKLQT